MTTDVMCMVKRRPGFSMAGKPRAPGEPMRFVRPRATWDPVPARAATGKKESMKGVVTDQGVRYGMPSGGRLREYAHTVKGYLEPTGDKITAPREEWRDVIEWGGKVVMIAESFYPHPKE